MVLCSKVSNLNHLGFSEFGSAIPLPQWVFSMSVSVLMVMFAGIPAKIGRPIMGADTVAVATLHPRGAWANEGVEDKGMDATVTIMQGNTEIAATVFSASENPLGRGCYDLPPWWLASLGLPVGSHFPLIGNLISRKTWDGFKNFLGCGKVLVSHGVSLLVRGTLGLEPYRCENSGAACSFIPCLTENGNG
jgi:hypothetical protein